MSFLDPFIAAVPKGKALFWILGGIVSAFGAGIGFAFGFGDTAESIALVPQMKVTVDDNVRRLDGIDVSLGEADDARDRILCIVSLNATAGTIVPSELDRECPP